MRHTETRGHRRVTGTLLFDGDCGFCTSSANLLMRIAPRARVVPWQRADLAALGETEERCRHEVRWVSDDRSHAGGATAVARVLATASPLYRLAGLLILASRPLSTVVYKVVAANRSHLPGATPACKLPHA